MPVLALKDLKEICSNLVADSYGFEKEPQIIMSEIQNGLTRNQVIAKVVSTVLGVAASFTLTYLGIKWLTDAMDPTKKEKKLAQAEAQKMLAKLGVENPGKLSDYELCVAANLLDPRSVEVTWEKIGGLDDTIENIQETVILPFKRADLFRNSSLLQPPKGILLYGPPGCGKTMIAKATAKAAGARFINLQISSLVDKWYGESQKRAEAVFSLAVKLQPTIVFIDEIDSFLRSRSSSDHEATAMMKTQFMSMWDGLTTDPNVRVMVMGATNRPQDVDAAILRRMPSQFYIGMPNQQQRMAILRLILENEEEFELCKTQYVKSAHQYMDAVCNLEDITEKTVFRKQTEDLNYDQLAQLSDGLSGSDLREACRAGAVAVVHEYMQSIARHSEDSGDAGDLRRMGMSDLQTAIHKVKMTKSMQARVFQPPPPLD